MVEKKRDYQLIVVIIMLIAIVLAVLFVIITSEKKTINNAIIFNEGNESTGCVTVYLEKEDNKKLYSFDDGKNWQKSNYGLVCKNGTTDIISKTEDGKIETEAHFKTDKLDENSPVFEINFDKEITSLTDESVLEEVNAFSNGKNISVEINYDIKDYDDNFKLITYKVEDKNGKRTKVSRKVDKSLLNTKIDNTETNIPTNKQTDNKIETKKEEKKELPKKEETPQTPTISDDIGIVYFDKDNYTCDKGNIILSKISVANTSREGVIVKNFESSNNNIATIEKNNEMGASCINCTAIKIICKNSGTVKLSATSSTGATTTASVVVKSQEKVIQKDVGTISFEKSTYSCEAGKTIETTITAINSSDPNVYVNSFDSNNKIIATIERNNEENPNCKNCIAVKINCLTPGNATFTATSSTKATTTASLEVTKQLGTILFDKDKYICKPNTSFIATITATNLYQVVKVDSFSSSNTNIATIEKDTSLVNSCTNCQRVKVTCKNSGEVTLSAKSTTGATTKSTVTVEKIDIGTISFDKNSYNCRQGEEITATITANSTDSSTVSSYSSSNPTIATIEKNPTLTPNCTNCVAVKISCKKNGSVTLSAKSSTGATTSSNINVKGVGTISYEKSSYTCKKGQTIRTMIKASCANNSCSESEIPRIKEYGSDNTKIAKVVTSSTIQVNCIDCRMVEIRCIKAGKTTIYAESSLGAKTTIPVTVK